MFREMRRGRQALPKEMCEAVLSRGSHGVLALAGDAGTELGTGGMVTKLRAADMCMEAGCDMIIMNGSRPADLYRAADGEEIGTRFIGKKEASL